ncbi:hypothetical protein JYU34_010974 [Plutella xylostella]|uniref:C2H2-type domain-containing protein n=1 Tax=Plutella xylostella TaxID=51655 RepID=A0ABQ7QFR2_PLUXY|nr:hypothetical protein JYU34_010974 [Plutella xylostella]
MLVFPHWRPEGPVEACRGLRWAPPERFASYIARPLAQPAIVYNTLPLQSSDEESSPGEEVCGWRGCGARVAGVARLSAHVARAHAQPRADGLFYCGWEDCARPNRGFNARYKMLVHVRTHTNERPHTCTQCNKSFSRAENLKIHLRSHSGEKPYACPYQGCGKAYSNSSDRFKHTRTHTVDKPYCCKVPGCSKRYTDPSSLRKHVKTYKHFVPKDSPRSSDNSREASPYSDVDSSTYQTHIPYHSPPRTMSPVQFSSVPSIAASSPSRYPAAVERVTYSPLEPSMYALRVPTYEMSYTEYSQMYEHAYRSYYSTGMDYPMLRSPEKVYAYDDVPMTEAKLTERQDLMYRPIEEMPLNLKCVKQADSNPMEELVRRDLPLDLSTKS